METKAPLESALESGLITIGMHLGERMYSDDINLQAEVDCSFLEVSHSKKFLESSTDLVERVLYTLFEKPTSYYLEASAYGACGRLFLRHAKRNGFEVEYSLDSMANSVNVPREVVDELIFNGQYHCESVAIGYDNNPKVFGNGVPIIVYQVKPNREALIEYINDTHQQLPIVFGDDRDIEFCKWFQSMIDKIDCDDGKIDKDEIPLFVTNLISKVGGDKQ